MNRRRPTIRYSKRPGCSVSEPLYLTDAERPLRKASTKGRYRYFLTFKLRQTIYTRWFRSPEDRSSYLDTLEGAISVVEGEDRAAELLEERRRINAVNRGWP